MKKLVLLPLVVLGAINSSARESGVWNQIWVAKLSAQRQCQEASEQNTVRLGEAISELERITDFVVQSAGLARLNDRMFCSACSCPAGIFYVAQIKADSSSKHSLPTDWEVINPESVQELSSSGKPLEFRILPVNPAH
jgi:hypothetical protein